MTMVPESQRLLEAMVAAYPTYVRSRLPATPEGIDDVLAQGAAWLRTTLTDLLALPFAEQRRGPLEVFQEAMRFPTEALRQAGVEPSRRDPVSETALPGDVYGLAPASSRDLGEEIWMIHLTWGATKASALTS
ncbi:MAG TPA: hypothetical protein VLB85_07255 [Acidimicrobiia bacterium]|nr:hypothetical protein [Acidimicrobiia bacterium]